ncbi:MAG: hypothetical protein ACC645_11625, partial [Pirellulales bacterium]
MRRIGDRIRPLLVMATFLMAARGPVRAADWPRYGHDAALTGRSPARGAIEDPHVSWTLDLSGRELL